MDNLILHSSFRFFTLRSSLNKCIIGTTNALSKVEVKRPPRITFAIGLCISLPGRSPPRARGIKARAEVRAVMRIGLRRSVEPCITQSMVLMPCAFRSLYLLTRSIPLRVAIPKRDMKPMMAGMLSMPLDSHTANTPPISAKGRFSNITNDSRRLRN